MNESRGSIRNCDTTDAAFQCKGRGDPPCHTPGIQSHAYSSVPPAQQFVKLGWD